MKTLLLTCTIFLITGCATKPQQLALQQGTAVRESIDDHPVVSKAVAPPKSSIVRWQEPRGLQVLYVQDDTIPLVRTSLIVPGGTLSESQEHIGSMSAMASLLAKGGAGDRTANQMDAELLKLAASMNSGISAESMSVGFSALSPDADAVFKLFLDVLGRPRFEQERVGLWKLQALEEIRRRKDSQDTVASLTLKRLLFGADHILGTVTTSKSVQAIATDSLKQLAAQQIGQNFSNGKHSILIVSGALSESQARRYGAELSALLPANTIKIPTVPLPEQQATTVPELVFVEQPLTQATVYIGQASPSRNPEREATIDLFNTYFGKGSFGSVLMKKVRTELGLAYGVFGAVIQAPIKSRSIMVVQTKSESTGLALQAMFNALKEVQGGAVENEILEEARHAELNGYPFLFDSKLEAASRAASQILLDYPENFDVQYPKDLVATRPEAITQIAQDYFDLRHIKIVLVGSRAALDALKHELSDFPPPLNSLKIHEATFDEVVTIQGSPIT